FDLELGVAEAPEAVAAYRRTLRGADVLVADTPAIDPDDPDCVARLAALLEALAPTETHLVAPLGASFESLRLALGDVRTASRVDAILVTHADEAGLPATAVGL